MIDQSKIKIVGAFVVGFAIVAGAYTVKNFGRPTIAPPETLSATAAEAPLRLLIDVKDSDENGIEDWQDELIKSTPVTIRKSDEEYQAPDTLTGQLSIAFFERIMTAKGYGSIGKNEEQIISETAEQVSRFGNDTIIDIKDVQISEDSSSEAVRNYANAHAEAIINNSVYGAKDELLILKDFMNSQNENDAKMLQSMAKAYLDTKEDVMSLSVPPQLVKEHLDLINVYNALYVDIDAMSKSVEDPVLSLVRLKRYKEDTEGLALALQNMYQALEPYAGAFNRDDSAILFVTFSPNLQ